MTTIIPVPTPDSEEPQFDFSSPEDVLIEVIEDELASRAGGYWNGFSIEVCTVIGGAEGVIGAASYEAEYGSFLDYTIAGLIDCPGTGWFVVEGVTGEYHKGDGWMTDDDMDFYYENVRPASEEEIKLA